MDVTAVQSLPAAATSTATQPPEIARSPGRYASTGGGTAFPAGPSRFRVTLDIDESSQRVVTTIINPETGEVVDQLPSEQLRKIAVAIREMLGPLVDDAV